MADQKISINIGTSYDGSGMAKAMSITDKLSKVSQKTAGAVGKLGQAFGGLDGQVGKAIGSISNFAGALAMGGPIGFAIAGIASVTSWLKDLENEADKADKKTFDNAIASIKSYQTSVNEATTALNNMVAAQNKVAQSAANVNATIASATAIQASIAGERAAANQNTDTGKAVARAEAGVNVARINGQTGINNAEANLRAAQNIERAANARVTNQSNAVAALNKRIEELTVQYDNATTEMKGAGKIPALLTQAQLELVKAEEELTKAQNEAVETSNKRIQAEVALDAAKSNAELMQVRADNALADAKKKDAEAIEAEAKKRKEEEDKAWDEAEKERLKNRDESMNRAKVEADREVAEKNLRDDEKRAQEAIDKARKAEEEHAQAVEELEAAEKEYAQKLKNAQVVAANGTWQGWAGNNNIPADQIANNGINGQSRYGARNNASKNDAAYRARVAAGLERNAISQGFGLDSNDRRRKRELEEKEARLAKRGEFLNDKDMAELGAINARDPKVQAAKAALEAKIAADKLKKAQENENTKRNNMYTNVAEMKALLTKLGLK